MQKKANNGNGCLNSKNKYLLSSYIFGELYYLRKL